MKKEILVIFFIFTVLAVSCGNGGDGSKTLTFSLILGENSDWYRGAYRFKELIEERTGGRYNIRIFPHAQLAGSVQRTELEMVQSGVIDMSLESSILLSLIEPRMSVFSMPWLFENYERAHTVLDGPLGDEMLALLPPKGLVGLAYGTNGFRQITNSRNPIQDPVDMKAMKIRVPAIKMYIDIFKMLGADPSSMNYGELFTALAQGIMDGQENPVSVIHSDRLYEVQHYLTVWNYSYDPIILCVNRRLWDSFTPRTRDIFTDCAGEAMRYERELVTNGERTKIDSLRTHGMVIHTLEKASLETFKALTEPVYEKYSGDIGAELIQDFRNAVKDLRQSDTERNE